MGAFETARDEAENVLADPEATQQEVDAALDKLTNAHNGLKKKPITPPDPTPTVNKSALEKKVGESSGLSEDDYTAYSWSVYEDALNNATNVLKDPNATQTTVNDALERLTNAQNGLEKKADTPDPGPTVDKSKLQAKADESSQLISEQYTLGSWLNYEAALGKAKAVLANPNATQAEVDQALATLTSAQNALVKTGGGGSPGTPVYPPVTPPTGPTTETIIVELEVDGDKPVEKTPVEITRTTETDGTVSDRVELTLKHAQQAVDKAVEIGNDIARIVLPDVKDIVDYARVEIPVQSMKLLRENGIDLQIYSNDVLITLLQTSM